MKLWLELRSVNHGDMVSLIHLSSEDLRVIQTMLEILRQTHERPGSMAAL